MFDNTCQWESCGAQFSSLDSLVRHLLHEHIKSRQSSYQCEWDNCPRKGVPQMSRFGLVSHVRTHTGEKPYFCIVPECSRSFTRSDALAKHLRTVHDANPQHEVEKLPWWYLQSNGDALKGTVYEEQYEKLQTAPLVAEREAMLRFLSHKGDLQYIESELFGGSGESDAYTKDTAQRFNELLANLTESQSTSELMAEESSDYKAQYEKLEHMCLVNAKIGFVLQKDLESLQEERKTWLLKKERVLSGNLLLDE